MVRAKMELIAKQKQRLQTINSRKECLNKKLHELTTLCNICACMIIYDPMIDRSFLWPDKLESFRRVIDSYNVKILDGNTIKRLCGVSDFLAMEDLRNLGRSNSDEDKPSSSFRCVIDSYNDKILDENAVKRCIGVSEFMAEEDLHNSGSSSSEEAQYPTWHKLYESMNEDQLRGVNDAMKHKVRIVYSRIQMMRMKEKQEHAVLHAAEHDVA